MGSSLTLVWDTGPSSSDLSSSQTTVTGIMSPGLIATISVDGRPTGQIVEAGGDGRITFDADPGPGTHVIQASQNDGTTASITITSTAPYAASTFLSGFLNLLPNGLAWPKRLTSTMSLALGALVRTFARNAGRASDVLGEAFPSTTRELLPEWESSLGIVAVGSDQARAAAVTAQLIGVTGPSIPSLIVYAHALGYSISITEQATLRPGISRLPSGVGDAYSPYTWVVTAPIAAQGSRLATSLRALAPSHTILRFVYI